MTEMEEELGPGERQGPTWGFIDGSVSVSASMLLAVLIHNCHSCNGVWLIGFLKEMSDKSAGLVVVATLLLFPTASFIFGGVRVFFAAKAAHERSERRRRAAERAAREAERVAVAQEARSAERERIGQAVDALTERGVPITQEEIARILEGDSSPGP